MTSKYATKEEKLKQMMAEGCRWLSSAHAWDREGRKVAAELTLKKANELLEAAGRYAARWNLKAI